MQADEIHVELIDGNGTVLKKAIRYDANAIAAFEKQSGISFMYLIHQMYNIGDDEEKIAKMMSIDIMRSAIWAGLLWRTNTRRPLKIQEVGAMMPMDFERLTNNAKQTFLAMGMAMGQNSKELEEATSENFTSAESVEAAPNPPATSNP